MKIQTNFYPFAVYAETKTSSAGNPYTSIGVCHRSKDKDGTKKKTYFNFVDKQELLVLAQACEKAYWDICAGEEKDHFAAQATETMTNPFENMPGDF